MPIVVPLLSDEALEAAIRRVQQRLIREPTQQNLNLFTAMLRARSPAQVERMERKQGLRP
jgi:hypothetical protein